MEEPKFKDYKEKQEYYKSRSKRVIARYDSGIRFNRKGEKRIKGIPYVKPSEEASKWYFL